LKENFSNTGPPGAPSIPDHHLLRRIGKGSYGEVWLARGVTGVLRAVKIVRRSDFDDERTFEREFEGIREYEPVSRSHRGLVHVLHIGRNEEEEFYYYVMELGDDALGDTPVNEVEYEPRTVRGDVMRRGRLPVSECVQVGEALADGLCHLHDQGLTHRDIKPSNVIFVEGVPKLADIGLVAPSGQRTFVGTEGFTPPEGPGTAQADIYSLGMVLYEVSSGLDRLRFPEVPTDLPDEERAAWLRVNEVICHACDPDMKERYATADEMHRDLVALQEGKKPLGRRKSRPVLMAAVVGMLAAASVTAFFMLRDKGSTSMVVHDPLPMIPEAPLAGDVKIVTQPEGAEILYENRIVGRTPHVETDLPVGPAQFTLKLDGFRTTVVDVEVEAGQMAVVAEELDFYAPPEEGKPWRNQLGMEFLPEGRNQRSRLPVLWSEFQTFLKATGRKSPAVKVASSVGGENVEVALARPEDAEAFCAWLLERGRRLGFLGAEHYYTFQPDVALPPKKLKNGKKLIPFTCAVRTFLYGSLHLVSVPEGAEIYEMPGGRLLGVAPLDLARVLPGTQSYQFRLEGHEKKEITVTVQPEQRKEVSVSLRPSRGVIFGRDWRNSLEMRLVPVGALMFSAWETRVSDWRAFQVAMGELDRLVPSANFKQKQDGPVAGVSREDAEEFCRWLTKEERQRGFIEDFHVYRLPTDAEWSFAVGLQEPVGRQPCQLDLANKVDFPWGRQWPPPEKAGNFADESAPAYLRRKGVIRGYNDGFAYTAPVGSFRPNVFGLYDMGGNVWEWVADPYGDTLGGAAAQWAVCRGGSWADGRRSALLSSMRNLLKPDFRRNGLYGFRVVLSRQQVEESEDGGAAEESFFPVDGPREESP